MRRSGKTKDMQEALRDCYSEIASTASVLDLGCLNFRQVAIAESLGLTNLGHCGVDYCDPAGPVPEGFTFRKADLNSVPIPFEDDRFDLVVASHLVEHLADPILFFGECVRVCRPGGLIYVEAPSERTLWLPGMPFDHERMYSLSFFDDPTHVSRPWTPQAFHRLARYFSCDPVRAGYLYGPWQVRLLFPVLLLRALLTRSGKMLQDRCWEAVGWCAFLVVRKPGTLRGKPEFSYHLPAGR